MLVDHTDNVVVLSALTVLNTLMTEVDVVSLMFVQYLFYFSSEMTIYIDKF